VGVQISRVFKRCYRVRQHLGEVLRNLAKPKRMQDRSKVSHADHVTHVDIHPPKYAVSQVVGLSGQERDTLVARVYGERRFIGQHFWQRLLVSTVRRNEEVIRNTEPEVQDPHHNCGK